MKLPSFKKILFAVNFRQKTTALAALALSCGAFTGWILAHFVDLPQVQQLETFRPSVSTYVYANDGSLLREFAEERRSFLPYAEIPRVFMDAVVAIEDSRFWEHWGIDFTGMTRAGLKNLMAGRVVEGGSSITQQLAKVLFLTTERTFRRKIQDIILALQIERRYSKERIMELYTNQIYLANGVYGLSAASDFYFGKEPRFLSTAEAALLAGLIRSPHRYDPYSHPERALSRRAVVLKRMAALKFLSEEEAACWSRESLGLRERKKEAAPGDYFIEETRRALARRFTIEQIYSGGLRVFTTMNPALQQGAEAALRAGLRALDKEKGVYRGPEENVLAAFPDLSAYHDPSWKDSPSGEADVVRALVMSVTTKKAALRVGEAHGSLDPSGAAWARIKDFSKTFHAGDVLLISMENQKDGSFRAALEQTPEIQGALLALDPRTGAVRAMVGGYDFAASEFNRAVQARRQAGSAFKPMVYTAAFESGFTLASTLCDAPTAFFDRASGLPYFPENYERDFDGVTTLRRALERSRNVVAVKLLNRFGARRVIETAKRFGLEGPFSIYPALALGASEVTLNEMVSAFSAFANHGERAEPYFVERIEIPSLGRSEKNFPKFSRAVSPEVAYVMTRALRGVVERGTAQRAAGLPGEVCGKTGTTNDLTDAWFIGFTPDLAVGVWVGYDTKRTMGRDMTGAHAALPIWMDFMRRFLENDAKDEKTARGKERIFPSFDRPARTMLVPVDRSTGLRATLESRCPDVWLETFVEGTEPAAACSEQAHRFMSLPWEEQRARAQRDEAPFSKETFAPPLPPSGEEALRFLDIVQNLDPKKQDTEVDFMREVLRIRSRVREGVPVFLEAVAR